MNVLIIRSGPYQVNLNSYNLQELGLAAALSQKCGRCDVMYYHKKKNFEQIVEKNGQKITIYWRKGVRLLRSGIYPQVLKKEFLDKYDVVIVSEYSQIMSYLVSKRHKNTFVYNGPYYNLFKLPFLEPIYDFLFCKRLNKNIRIFFCKTDMAAKYIAKKGLFNTVTVGVGLDTSEFEAERKIDENTLSLLRKMDDHRNLLYVGSIIPRKNVGLIIQAFGLLKKCRGFEDVQLVIVGKGDRKYMNKCLMSITDNVKKDIIWCEYIKNAQLKYIYKSAYAFLLPSILEIFGMVLLESMYYGLPVISSKSAGADTLIQNKKNGIIIENFDEKNWTSAMQTLLEDASFAKKLGDNASSSISENYMWDSVAEKMVKYIDYATL